MKRLLLAVAAVSTLASVAAAECPASVTDAAKKAHVGATVTKCVAEGAIFEVKLARTDKSVIELDIKPDGTILQTEEIVALSTLPEAVSKAVKAKYPKAEPKRAEKQTRADHSVSYEVAMMVGKKMLEATFKADGTFVEEE